MILKKKSILLILVFLIGCTNLCACGKEESGVGELFVEDTKEEASMTEETKNAEHNKSPARLGKSS